MAIRVAVVDPLPMFACGLMTTLSAEGFDPQAPDDLVAWAAAEKGPTAVLLSVLTPYDWSLLEEVLRVRNDASVVALLDNPSLTSYLRAIGTGASSVLPRDSAPSMVKAAFCAAVDGMSLLPVEMVRSLAANQPDRDTGPLSAQEIDWLRRLTDGTSVSRLATRVGYSERMMFRLLAQTYAKLGAENRTKAIIQARDRGWI